MASIVRCFVGSNTGSPDLQALHVLDCDTETGSARIVQSVKGYQGTTYFQLSPANDYLYTAIAEPRGEKKGSAAVRFPIVGGRLGAIERIAALPSETPCHVSLFANGTRLAYAAYTSATVTTLKTDGTELKSFVFPNDAVGPNRLRQKKAYAHFTFFTPDESRLGVVDLGSDRVWFFNPVTLARETSMVIAAQPGEGPRHAVWSKGGRVLYVLNELGSSVAAYRFDGAAFARLGAWSMLPEGFNRWAADGETLVTKAAAIKLTADGKILMASNRGYDSIAFYDVCASGELKLRNIATLRGKFPRDFELLPGEKFMIVGHKMSDEIQMYRFDREACTLTPVGEPIPAWRPLCFKFPHRS